MVGRGSVVWIRVFLELISRGFEIGAGHITEVDRDQGDGDLRFFEEIQMTREKK